MTAKHAFWVGANWWGLLFGYPWAAPLHRTLVTLSLHALGYDNARHTGEEWFITHVLKKEEIRVCIDVGANVGAYSKMLVDNLDCHVHAIEPAAASFATLQSTIGQDPRVTLHNCALSSTVGTGTLHSRHELSEKATLNPTLAGAPLQEAVPLQTLDRLVEEHVLHRVDFIKIDTESHELEVFKGMHDTLQKLQPRFIQFEFNHAHLRQGVTLLQLAQHLPHYTLYRLLPHGLLPIDPTRYIDNIYMFSNIVGIRSI